VETVRGKKSHVKKEHKFDLNVVVCENIPLCCDPATEATMKA